jgi:hypothetical protein
MGKRIIMVNISIFQILSIIIYDLLFSLFVVFVEPYLLPELKNYANNVYDRSSLWIAVLILSALAAEVPGVYLKFKSIGSRMLKDGNGRPGENIALKLGVLLLVLHSAIGVLVMLFAFRALGLDFHRNENLFRLFFLAALARESIIVYFIFSARIPREQIKNCTLKNTIADLCLFFFNIITFTATWRVIPESGKTFQADSIIELILLIFFTSILFLMFYLSSNMTSVYENFVTVRSRRQLLYRFASLLFIVTIVIYPMCPGRNAQKSVPHEYSDSFLQEKIKAEKLLRKNMIKEMNNKKK